MFLLSQIIPKFSTENKKLQFLGSYLEIIEVLQISLVYCLGGLPILFGIIIKIFGIPIVMYIGQNWWL